MVCKLGNAEGVQGQAKGPSNQEYRGSTKDGKGVVKVVVAAGEWRGGGPRTKGDGDTDCK